MKVRYLIGALGRGGSERQLVELAAGLSARGHDVQVLCYQGAGPLDAVAEERGVAVQHVPGGTKREKLALVRRRIREDRPEILHGFMKRASSLAVLSNLPGRECRVVASDLSTATYSRRQPVLWAALAAFAIADVVATQTEMNRGSIRRLAPWLRRKTVVIRNGVDTDRFRSVPERHRGAPFRFVCVGSVYRVKNPERVVEAVRLLRDRGAAPFRVDWFGRRGLGGDAAPSAEHDRAAALVAANGLDDIVAFHGETTTVAEVYRTADAVLHPSLQEGMPNAVVEGMASGLPVVVSRVSDLPLIVAEARNGFVCDPHSADAIADAMARMLAVPAGEWLEMGVRSRALAVAWFGMSRFVAEYESLYRRLLEGRR